MVGASHQHSVQFYEDDRFLCEGIARYLAAAIAEDHPIVVIATLSHRELIARNLADSNFDIAKAQQSGRAAWLDAGDLLRSFMVGSVPDPELFHKHVGAIVDRVTNHRPALPVHAYGEMVDVLCKEGNAEAAVRLEELWNDFAK